MNRNHLVPRPTAPPTRGEEEKRAACTVPLDLISALIDSPRRDDLAREAASHCRSCPLAASCLTSNADQHWEAASESIRTILAGGSVKEPRPKSKISPARAAMIQRKHDDRLRRIRRYANDGLDLDAVLKRLDISRPALWQWCERYDHLDLFHELTARRVDRRKLPRRRVA